MFKWWNQLKAWCNGATKEDGYRWAKETYNKEGRSITYLTYFVGLATPEGDLSEFDKGIREFIKEHS